MPPYAWHPQHPNHMPSHFLNDWYRHTGMPPRRNYEQPMDAAVASEYYAHMRGVPLQSAPPVSSHVQATTNCIAPLDIDQCADCQVRQIYDLPRWDDRQASSREHSTTAVARERERGR